MTTDLSKPDARDLTAVADVDGADPDISARVSRSGADAEAATAITPRTCLPRNSERNASSAAAVIRGTATDRGKSWFISP